MQGAGLISLMLFLSGGQSSPSSMDPEALGTKEGYETGALIKGCAVWILLSVFSYLNVRVILYFDQ
jgi:hypothetical protein